MGDSRGQILNDYNRNIILQIRELESSLNNSAEFYNKHRFETERICSDSPTRRKILNIFKKGIKSKEKELRSLKSKLIIC